MRKEEIESLLEAPLLITFKLILTYTQLWRQACGSASGGGQLVFEDFSISIIFYL